MAKKSTEKNEPAKKPAAPAKKTAAGAKGKAPAASAKKQATGGSGGGTPQVPSIDTNLAASNAAAMILNRAATGGNAQGGANQPAKKESAAFKNLKDSLNKPASGGLGGNFGSIGAQKKSGQNFGGGKQVGRNQTFGADVNRTGVPRRTGGG
ncbi:MAG: hypothetical protein M3478_02795 [Planctomycetota bacterium]|nr:hypothetical protein [Planctomycetota bacterium]